MLTDSISGCINTKPLFCAVFADSKVILSDQPNDKRGLNKPDVFLRGSKET